MFAGPRATLLVVADAHNGAEAAEVAVVTLTDALGADPPPADLGPARLVELLHATEHAIWVETRRHRYPRRGSRTAISLALVTAGRAQWASVGDTAVILRRADAAVLLSTPQPIYLGTAAGPEQLADVLQVGSVDLRPGDGVVLASDGFVDFVGDPATAVDEVTAECAGLSVRSLVAQLVQRAFSGRAGDNVAVAAAFTDVPAVA